MHRTEPGLAHYLQVLRRGWWIIALTVALTTSVAVYASKRQTALYNSSADVFLSAQNLAATVSNVQAPSTDPIRERRDAGGSRPDPGGGQASAQTCSASEPQRPVASLELVCLAGRERRHSHILRHRPQPPDRRTARRRLRHRLHPVPSETRHGLDRRRPQADPGAAREAEGGGRTARRGLREPVREGPAVAHDAGAAGIERAARARGKRRRSDPTQTDPKRSPRRDARSPARRRHRLPA